MEQDKSEKNDIIDEFGFGIYGCRRKSRYGSSCCGYRFHIELAQFWMELHWFPAWVFKVFSIKEMQDFVPFRCVVPIQG